MIVVNGFGVLGRAALAGYSLLWGCARVDSSENIVLGRLRLRCGASLCNEG